MIMRNLMDAINAVMLPFGGLFFLMNLYYISYNKTNKKSFRLNIILCGIMMILFGFYFYRIFLEPVEPLS